MKRRTLLKITTASVVAVSTAAIPKVVLSQSEPSRSTRLSKAVPFKISVPQATLDGILNRVRNCQWPDEPAKGGWEYGPNLSFMKELAAYWVSGYDWRKVESAMNRVAQYKAQVDGEALHFFYEQGSGRNPQPLLLLHGWPYSFHSLLSMAELLAHPERFGGNAADGLDIIVPSLPGFGFSDKPANPIAPRAIAPRMQQLMTKVLGYDRYIVHAGDWGAHIAAWMGFNYPQQVKGLHLNGVFVRHHGAAEGSGQPGSGSAPKAEELAFLERERQVLNGPEAAYARLQAVRPQALGYALMDSPVGAAAWLVDKFYSWSDHRERDFEEIFSRDQLLTEVTLQLVTRTINSATWIYAGFAQEGVATLPPGEKIQVPTAVAAFPDPFSSPPPRSWAERSYNIVQWTEPERGGHFPSIENPSVLINDIRKFGQALRVRAFRSFPPPEHGSA